MTGKPITHADAELVLRLYDLRREPLMREGRTAIISKFHPRSFADVTEVMTSPTHPLNQAFRQVGTYWEMVYSFAKHGIINPDFLIESNGEGLFLFAKVERFIKEIRAEISPTAFQNAQWMTENSPEAKKRFELAKIRLEKMAAAAAK